MDGNNNGNGQKYGRGESFSAAALMNRGGDHAFDAPGGIAFRLNPDAYSGGKNSAEREKVASFVNNWIQRTKDPASDIPGAPPLFGQDVVPQAMTFASKIGSQAKTYLPSDEALEANPNDALLMRKDLGIMECLEIRQRMSALLDWSIVPEDTKSPAQKSVAAELTKIVRRVRRFTEYKRCLMDAIWIGRSAIQHTYGHGNIGGKMYCYPRAKHADATGWKHIHGDKIVFRYDDGEKLANGAFPDQMGIRVSPVIQKDSRIRGIQDLEYTNSGAAIFLSPAERQTIICHKHMIEDAEYQNPRKAGRIHGVGIRDRIYNEWFLKQEMLGFLMEYMERSAGGIEIYEYPSGDESAKKSIMEAAKNRMAFGRNQIFFPKPLGMDAGVYDIRIVEPGFAGMDMLVNILDKYFGHRIKRYIIGQTLSTEADATGLGSSVADFQKDSLAQIVMYDSSNLEETLTHELVRPIHLANWPETESWQFELKLELESDNVKEKLDSYQTAWSMGLGIPEKDVAEAIGVSLDNPNEKMLRNTPAGLGGMGNGMQFPAGTGFGNQIDAAHEHVKAAGEVKGLKDGVIDHVAGKVNGNQGEESGPPSSPAAKPDQYQREFSESDHPRDESGKFTSSSSSADNDDNNDESSTNSLPDYKNAQPRLISETKTPMGKVSIVSGSYKKEQELAPGEFRAETFAQVWRGHEMLEEFSSSDADEAIENASDLYNDTIEHARRKGEAVDSGEESRGIAWNVHHDGKGMMEIYVFGPDGNVIHKEGGFDSDEDGEAVEAAKRIAREMGEELADDDGETDDGDDPEKYQRRSHRLLSEAASSTHTSPTPAQREAGNYSKGIFPWKGLEIAIENPKGSTRSGVSPSTGREWSRTMSSHYGYFRRTKANDGDNLDVFIGPHPDSEFVLVIKQVDQDGDFDEFKVVVGCLNRKEAKKLYLANYPKGWKCGPAASMTVELFKKWVEKGGPMREKSVKVEKYNREFNEQDHPRMAAGNEHGGEFVGNNKEEPPKRNETSLVPVPGMKNRVGYPVRRIHDSKSLVPKVSISQSGEVSVSAASHIRYGEIQQAIKRAADEMFWPFKENEFVRVHFKKEDYEHLKNGTHRGSVNHATGELEGGLSVAKSVEFPSKYAYLVSGNRVGEGSDGEPLIDTESAKVSGKIMSMKAFEAMFDQAMKKKQESMGWTDDQIASLKSSPVLS
jgi:phage gp29-like protein